MEKHSYVKNQMGITKATLKFIGVFVLCLIFTSSFAAATNVNMNTAASDSLMNSTVDTSQHNSIGSKIDVPSESINYFFTSTTVYVGQYPHGIAMSPDGKKVYVVNSGDGNVSVINTTTDNVVANVNVKDSPTQATISPDGKKLDIPGTSKINVIDTETNKVIATFSTSLNFI
jgi:YVTN family beta-propeller protein